jgi:hypothetical protein
MNFWLVIIAILGMAGTYFFGFWQGRTSKRSFDLTVAKAMPKVGVTLTLDKRQVNPPAFPPFYFLITRIYNEGELPARQLNGKCRLFSPGNQIKEQTIPIAHDFLGGTPHNMQSNRIDGIDGPIRGDQSIDLQVEIDFDYVGIPDDKTQHYYSHYKYDKQSGQFLKTKSH